MVWYEKLLPVENLTKKGYLHVFGRKPCISIHDGGLMLAESSFLKDLYTCACCVGLHINVTLFGHYSSVKNVTDRRKQNKIRFQFRKIYIFDC